MQTNGTGRDLGPIGQLGYVVPDVHEAMDRWRRHLDVGPFVLLPSPPLNDVRYRGQPTAARIAVALAYSGDLQVELIEPLDDHPSPYRDFLRLRGAGLHHVARFPADYDGAVEAYRARGLTPYYEGQGLTEDQRFAYFESGADDGTVLELVETASIAAFFDFIRARSESWDGVAPVHVIEL